MLEVVAVDVVDGWWWWVAVAVGDGCEELMVAKRWSLLVMVLEVVWSLERQILKMVLRA
jgi:hypothetical protein